MEEPNFWDNPEEAQEQMKQLSSMKEDRDTPSETGIRQRRYGNSD